MENSQNKKCRSTVWSEHCCPAVYLYLPLFWSFLGMAMGMSSQAGYGMQGSMMTPGGSSVRMQSSMNVQNTMVGTAAFQQKTDNAFAGFGALK